MNDSISYTVIKITEKKISNNHKRVTAVIDKTMRLSTHLLPTTETFEVAYPVWDNEHRPNLVEAVQPYRKIDDTTRIMIAKELAKFKLS